MKQVIILAFLIFSIDAFGTDLSNADQAKQSISASCYFMLAASEDVLTGKEKPSTLIDTTWYILNSYDEEQFKSTDLHAAFLNQAASAFSNLHDSMTDFYANASLDEFSNPRKMSARPTIIKKLSEAYISNSK